MDVTTGIVTAFGVLATSVIALFGWMLKQTNLLAISQAGLAGSIKEMIERVDKLVSRLDANFSLQISEQVARNVLAEKVQNLEIRVGDCPRLVAELQRQLTTQGRRIESRINDLERWSSQRSRPRSSDEPDEGNGQ